MRTLGVLSKPYTTVFDVPFSNALADELKANYLATVYGAVDLSWDPFLDLGFANFHNSSSERISYYPPFGVPAKLRLQTDTEFTIRFLIVAKGGVHVLMSCLNAANDNGFYIFVNDTIPALGFYGVGLGGVGGFISVPISIGVLTTVRCICKRSTNQLIVYVDDVLAGTESGVQLNDLTNEPRYVYLGAFSDTNTAQPLNGTIDYVLIKDKTG
jgi:hypothetical protein